jgi:C-terminal processing protease CtpA/Prc
MGMKSRGRRAVRAWIALAMAVLLPACGRSTLTDPLGLGSSTDCSTTGKVLFVRDTLRDIYLWYRELPNPDPASFSTPEAYLEAVRYKTLDSTFSFISLKSEDEAFFSESQFIGFGFSMTLLSADELRVTDVYADSPAAEAGLERGARLLDINGRAVTDILAKNELGTIFGPSTVGVTGRVHFLDRAGRDHDATMTKRVVTIPTVTNTQTFNVGGRTVGYLVFKNFVSPGTAALRTAFAQLADAGATEVVLDLRYNGGGLVSVAQDLGGLIGGRRTSGQPFVKFVHNDKNSSRDSTLNFPTPGATPDVQRLVVIATRGTASASELIVNGLRPYMPVVIVGDRTYGKPVGQYSFTFCDKVLHPVSFATKNARGEGDYFGGLPADCAAPDDVSHAFGDPSEASLAAALAYLRTGACSASASAAARAQSLRRPEDARQPHRENGWQQLIGAY